MSVEVTSLYVIALILITLAMMVSVLAILTGAVDKYKAKKAVHKAKKAVSDKEFAKSRLNDVAPYVPPKTYETYDHPAPPIALLGASLCGAPLGYGWEITAVINDAGNPALRLAMLDLKTTTEVDVIERDMIIVRKWQYADDDTYAAFYRRAKAIEQIECDLDYEFNLSIHQRWHGSGPIARLTPTGELPGKVMMANLITPIVDWAALLTLRYIIENPDETRCNYMLIESMGGPSTEMVHS